MRQEKSKNIIDLAEAKGLAMRAGPRLRTDPETFAATCTIWKMQQRARPISFARISKLLDSRNGVVVQIRNSR
jgi:hypothetical protein